MSEWGARVEVARWEFRRFVKPKQLAFSLVITLAMGVLGYGAARLAQGSQGRIHTVAVIGGEALGLAARDTVGNVELVPAAAPALDSLRAALAERELAGILRLQGTEGAELIVRRDPAWRRTLEGHLAAARQRVQLARAGLEPGQLAALLAPVLVTVSYQAGSDSRGARIAALMGVGLILYGVFVAMAYMLASITAEKQLRVTEQVVAAITPQTWIDGKILGIGAVSLVNVVLAFAAAALWVGGRALATGSRFSLGTAHPAAVAWIALFAVLGFAFWLTAFGAIAATIDDPNTSTRGPLMFVPAMFAVVGFMIVPNPDSAFARIAGLVPLTSSSVMPARVALTDVPLWELLLSAALLAAGTLLARRAAGKVFAMAMLLYGKEPTWREMRRWVRET